MIANNHPQFVSTSVTVTPALQIQNLSYIYGDGNQALERISLKLMPGERVALVGANGSGKSTLQRQLNGLLTPTAGEIIVNGLPVIPAHYQQIRQWVGMVFQNPDDQLFMHTVAEDIAFGLRNFGVPAVDCPLLIDQALRSVGLDPDRFRARYPDHLSGGEKKRVAIAGILALTPLLLVLDEPTAQLDPRARRLLMALLQQLPYTQLIATHDLDLAITLCERTLILHQGQLVYDGCTQMAMMDGELLTRYGLELPLGLSRPYCSLADAPGCQVINVSRTDSGSRG